MREGGGGGGTYLVHLVVVLGVNLVDLFFFRERKVPGKKGRYQGCKGAWNDADVLDDVFDAKLFPPLF